MSQSRPSSFADRPVAALAVVSVGTFMSTLDGNIVNVALPAVAEGFGAALPLAQWIVSAYLLAICCLLPLFGRLGDAWGKRTMYRLGFAIFGAASIWCGAAWSLPSLIAARIVQGLGGAMLMANGPGVVAQAFPGAGRGRAFGIMGSVVALGSLTGPALGGALLAFFGWRSIFYVNAPVAVLGVIFAHTLLPRSEDRFKAGFDPLGLILFATAITTLLMGLSHGRDWPAPLLAGCGLGALFLFVLFGRTERRVRFPMIDLGLLSHPPFLTGNLTSFLCFTAIFANAILMPFYLHDARDVPPMTMGGVLAVLPLVMAVVSPFAGRLSERLSRAGLAGAGLVAVAAGLANQATLDLASPLWRACLGQALVGLGVGAFISPNNNSILSSAPASKSGLAGSLLALTRNVGMVTGIAVATGVFETVRASYLSGLAAPAAEEVSGAFLAGFRCALATGAALALCGAVLSFSRRRFRNREGGA